MTDAAADYVTVMPPGEDFARLFRENYELVYRAAFSVTGNAEDAEDVLQTLFAHLLQREFPPAMEPNPRAYLYRSAINAALDLVRKRSRKIESVGPVSFVEVGQTAEIREWLSGALAKLSPREAEVFVLRHIEGYTNVEIAGLLGTSRGTVAVMLFRIRSRLKKSLRRHFGDTL